MQIHIFVFSLLLQASFGCRQAPADVQSRAAAGINFHTMDAIRVAPPLTTDIVYKSVDGGQTWQDVSAGLPADVQILTVFADDNDVFLGSENGLYRSALLPADRHWTKEFFPVERITDISPGWAGPYIGSYGEGVFQLAHGRSLWRSMLDALHNKTVIAFLETPDKSLLVACDNGMFKSADGGKTWKQVFTEGPVSTLAEKDGVLIGSGLRGVLRSTDGGENWNWVLTEDGRSIKTGRFKDHLFAITTGLGPREVEYNDPPGLTVNRLRTSADGGKTWQAMDESLALAMFMFNPNRDDVNPPRRRTINDIDQMGEYLFCSLEAGVFRSSDGGKTWKLVLPSDGGKTFEMTASGNVIFVVSVSGGC